MMGMPLWLGAKLMPRYTEKTACCTAMKASAFSGDSTQSTMVRYSGGVQQRAGRLLRAAARSRRRARRLMPSTCMPLLRSSMRGKNSGACQRASHDGEGAAACPPAGRGRGGCFADVGVAAPLVGVGMVGVVLGNPPAEAQPGQRVAHGEAEQAVAAACPEHLVVPGVMADEAQLGEHDPQQRGDGQGRPRVTGDHQQRPSGGKRQDRHGDLHPVVAGPAVEQAHPPHPQRQHAETRRRRIASTSRPRRRQGPARPHDSNTGRRCLRRSTLPGVFRAHHSDGYVARVWSNKAAVSTLGTNRRALRYRTTARQPRKDDTRPGPPEVRHASWRPAQDVPANGCRRSGGHQRAELTTVAADDERARTVGEVDKDVTAARALLKALVRP